MSCKVVYVEALFNLGYQNTLIIEGETSQVQLDLNKLSLKLFTHDQDLRICKFCIYANFTYVSKSIFLLCVHMAFKDQQKLSKVEILSYKSNRNFLELRTCLNILIWILQVSKLLLDESTYVTMHML